MLMSTVMGVSLQKLITAAVSRRDDYRDAGDIFGRYEAYASIFVEQDTVDLNKKTDAKLTNKGQA